MSEEAVADESVSQERPQVRHYGRANVIGVLNGMQSSAITVRQARCAMVRNRNANCMKCAEACTSGCIHLSDGVLCVDESKCVGCGTCATVCPTCALEAHNPSDSELTCACEKAQCGSTVVIMCHPCAEAYADLVDTKRFAEVVCLGRVDESLICGLAAKGVREVLLVSADCDRCDQAKGRQCAQMVAKSANNLLGLWRRGPIAKVVSRLPDSVLLDPNCATPRSLSQGSDQRFSNTPLCASEGGEGAKGSVSAGVREGAEAGACEGTEAGACEGAKLGAEEGVKVGAEEGANEDALSRERQSERMEVLRVMKDGTLPHFVPDRREHLLDALASLGKPAYDTVVSRLWGCVAIDPFKCVSCRMCATFCPTGAIAKFDSPDGTFGVEHYPGDCVKCGTCEAICPAHAIEIRPSVKMRYLFDGDVHRFEMRKRVVELNRPDQILNTMKCKIPGNIYER